MFETKINNRAKIKAILDAKQILASELETVEAQIRDSFQSDVRTITKINQHIGNGGKRLRPIITLLSASSLGDINQETINIATIVELIHLATLLHDDVIDNAKIRHNKNTANVRWGNSLSILSGDYIYSKAFKIIAGGLKKRR